MSTDSQARGAQPVGGIEVVLAALLVVELLARLLVVPFAASRVRG